MTFKNIDDIYGEFDNFVELVRDPDLQKCCMSLKGYEKFWTCVGSPGHHHAYKRGLIIHTLEVVDICLSTARMFPKCDTDILITAALWHDLAKIWEYEMVVGKWQKTDYHGKVHHITGSTAEFTAVARGFGVHRDTVEKIQHCIISHHGNPEYGSIRRPESLEAIILSSSDMLGATHSVYPKQPF